MERVKQHRSMESAWAYLLHLEEEEEDQGKEDKSEEQEKEDKSEDQEDIPLDEQLLHLNDGAKLIIGMVGKPARGKTFLARKIQRYCEWLGYRVKHVETVAIRREMFGRVEPDDFFDESSIEMSVQRKEAQEKALQMSIEWLQNGGQVVIYDATNSTRARRDWVKDYVEKTLVDKTEHETVVSHRILWVESLCDKSDIIEQNFYELRKKSPTFQEYEDMTDEQAKTKFHEKLRFYDQEYEELNGEVEDISYIKIKDFGDQVVINKIHGFLESKLVSFCMNIHTEPRVIVLVRHGQSEYNLQDRIGGDPPLTEAGHQFAKNLAKFIDKEAKNGLQVAPTSEYDTSDESTDKPSANAATMEGEDQQRNPYAFDPKKDLFVWSSNLRRTVDSVKHIECRAKVPWVALAEIDAGICECMTYKDFKEKLATQYMKRQRNKATWRYPGGESYVDVKKRLEPVIFELERQRKPIVVCSHRAVLRCLYSYFVGISIQQAPFLPFPLHTALILTPTSSGWKEDRVPIPPNVSDLGAHEHDVQAAAAKISKNKAKKRRLEARNK